MSYKSGRRCLHTLIARLRQWLTALILLVREIWVRLTGWDRASSEAMHWVVTLHSCSDVTTVLPDFRRWADKRAVNSERFAELWGLWQELGTFKDTARWREPNLSESRHEKTLERTRFPWKQAAALTVVVVSLLGIGITYWSRGAIHPADGTVAHDARQQHLASGVHHSGADQSTVLQIADGSVITLREFSQVTLDFGLQKRHVTLDQGEARFEVAKNPDTPFLVAVNAEATVKAVGTTFWVKRTGPTGGLVKVDEGAVELMLLNQPSVPVKAGQVAEFERGLIRLTDSSSIRSVSDGPSVVKVSLIFRGESLRDAAREFNRYNQKRKISVDEAISQLSVGGKFEATHPQQFASAVAVTWNLQCSISHDSSTNTDIIHLGMADAPGPHHSARSHAC